MGHVDKTIDSALLGLRKKIIRGVRKGLQNVEALLRQRGVALPLVRPAWSPAGKGIMARMALDALKDGAQTARYMSECIAARRPEIP